MPTWLLALLFDLTLVVGIFLLASHSAPLGLAALLRPSHWHPAPLSSPLHPAPAAALLATCHALRGRGPAYYAALPQARHVTLKALEDRAALHPEDGACGGEVRGNDTVVHCCVLRVAFQGLAGNILTQFTAGRYFAELNSCAMPVTVLASQHSPHNEMGMQPGALALRELQWPLAAGAQPTGANELNHLVDAYGYFRAPLQADTTFKMYAEDSSLLYSALSFGWDLAGGSLMWSGVRGLNMHVISGNSTAERGQRWGAHREACAQAGVQLLAEAQAAAAVAAPAAAAAAPATGAAAQPLPPTLELAVATVLEGLHPWLATQLVEEVQQLLLGTHARMTPQLRTFLAHPERTMVIHMRLGDQYRKAIHDAQLRSEKGIQGGQGTDALDWLGPKLWPNDRVDLNAMPPQLHLDMLDGNAARVDMVFPPLSYYSTVLRGAARAWDHVLVVGDASLAANPVFQSLAREFNATLQSGNPAMDMAVLVLARQLVVSGGSTFSFMAAAQGRARVIHAPHLATMSTRTGTGTCFVTPSRFDARWVFHDVFRAGVRRVARGFAAQAAAARKEGWAKDAIATREWALGASGGAWGGEHVEFRAQPLAFVPPEWSSSCPPDVEGFGAEGLARALGEVQGSGATAAATGMPLYFLTYEQLLGYYRRPACSRYFFPGFAQDMVNNNRPIPEEQWNTCVDDAPLAPLNEGAVKGLGCRLWGQGPVACEGL